MNYVKLSKYASFLEKPSKKTFKNMEVRKDEDKRQNDERISGKQFLFCRLL